MPVFGRSVPARSPRVLSSHLISSHLLILDQLIAETNLSSCALVRFLLQEVYEVENRDSRGNDSERYALLLRDRGRLMLFRRGIRKLERDGKERQEEQDEGEEQASG